MNQENNSPGNDRDAYDGKTGAEGQRVDPEAKHNPNGPKDEEHASHNDKKPSVVVRLWHSLLRRRHWRALAGHPKSTIAEKVTVFITACLLLVGAMQAYIYWNQTELMKLSLSQTQQSIALNTGQLAIAGRNATTAQNALTDQQKSFVINERPYVVAEIPEFSGNGLIPDKLLTVNVQEYWAHPCVEIH